MSNVSKAVPAVRNDLVFDIGMHQGEDAAYYLSKGFRVVGVEAVPQLAEVASALLRVPLDEGRLTVVNAAIAGVAGPVEFFVNENSLWGTSNPAWRDRNERLGFTSVLTVTARGICCSQLFADYGVPYYMKIDIEGADLLCVEALRQLATRCPFVSLESDKTSWQRLKEEIDLLDELGYRRFKVVAQHKVHRQTAPCPAREGAYVDHRFAPGQSGLFGEEAPGRWLTRRQALAVYRLIFLRYWVIGDDGLLSRPPLRKLKSLLGRLGVGPGWYDTHAGR